MEKENVVIKNKTIIKWIFLGWLITLPFGSSLFLFDIGTEKTGYFTLYPSLFLAFILLFITPWVYKLWGGIEKISIAFLGLWMASSFLYIDPFDISEYALFDIRSLIIQFIYCVGLVNAYYVLKLDFKPNLIIGLKVFLFILILFGVFEFSTGIHFESDKTAEMTTLVIGKHFNAPMFLYGNQNNYLVYIIFIFLSLSLFDEKIQKNNYLLLLISGLILIFSIYADSKFSKIISLVLIAYFLVGIVKGNYSFLKFNKLYPYFISILLLSITLLVNPIFFGPKFKNSAQYRLNEINIIEKDSLGKINVVKAREKLSKKDQSELVSHMDSVRTKGPGNSKNIRKNLILNGLDYIRMNPILGLGPGGYEERTIAKGQKKYVDHQISPHNFPIEVISKFGVFGWGYFVLLFWLSLKIISTKHIEAKNNKGIFILLLIALPVLWLMPASYLFLDTHKLLIPFILLFSIIHDKKSDTKAEKPIKYV